MEMVAASHVRERAAPRLGVSPHLAKVGPEIGIPDVHPRELAREQLRR